MLIVNYSVHLTSLDYLLWIEWLRNIHSLYNLFNNRGGGWWFNLLKIFEVLIFSIAYTSIGKTEYLTEMVLICNL